MSQLQEGPGCDASQLVKGESQEIKAENDPLFVNLKVKQQVPPTRNILLET
jgi:hypothetical protein